MRGAAVTALGVVGTDRAIELMARVYHDNKSSELQAIVVMRLGELKSAKVVTNGVEFAYQSSVRAMATLERAPRKVEIDGAEVKPQFTGNVLILPRGQHLVTLSN